MLTLAVDLTRLSESQLERGYCLPATCTDGRRRYVARRGSAIAIGLTKAEAERNLEWDLVNGHAQTV